MPLRIAIVDPRPDLLEFLKEQLKARGYDVEIAFTEAEVEQMDPLPDLAVVDFERTVDLAEVMQAIAEGLRQEGKIGHLR
ncbi:response regulator transcription factor [bacterium]|nr:response regulator transcription factor [bacterium]